MTDDSSSTTQVTDESGFNDRLRELLIRAHKNDVDVEGGWECRNHDDSVPDWDVDVITLEDNDK